MRIVIDISRLHPAALKRGVGFYALNLFTALKDLHDDNEYLFKKQKAGQIWSDIVHFPYFDPFFLTLPIVKKTKIIVTVHDLTLLKFPDYYPSGIRGKIKWQIQKRLLKKADAIITDSRNSKEDINAIIGYPKDKIFVVNLAAGKEFTKLAIGNPPAGRTGWQLTIKEKYQLPDIFLLYVGDVNWNKNIKGLIKAFYQIKTQMVQPKAGRPRVENIKTTIQKLKLILIGSAFKNDNLFELHKIKKLIKELNIEREVKLLGFVPIEDLVAIYNLATLYIQPSFYEGFGLPVLEAMSCGCPVLSSNQASLSEIGGQSVEYFNPFNQKDFATKLINLLNNKNKLASLSSLGLIQAKKFSWERTALETKKVYKIIVR